MNIIRITLATIALGFSIGLTSCEKPADDATAPTAAPVDAPAAPVVEDAKPK